MSKESLEKFGTSVPMGRAGQPVEVATAFVYLSSADSSYIRYFRSCSCSETSLMQTSRFQWASYPCKRRCGYRVGYQQATQQNCILATIIVSIHQCSHSPIQASQQHKLSYSIFEKPLKRSNALLHRTFRLGGWARHRIWERG